jgi:TetR/AcrR family transcriptional repressor of nem operon
MAGVMKKGIETRLRIIAQAAPIFNRKGYDGCSLKDILDATGLQKGGLYRHFASKEALGVVAFEYAWGKTTLIATAHLDSIPNSVDKLKAHVDQIVSGPVFPGGCPLLNASVHAKEGEFRIT